MTILLVLSCQILLNDFDLGRKYFDRGDFSVARAFFQEYLAEDPKARSVPEAEYYLIRISDATGDFTGLVERSGRYLREHAYGLRRAEVFDLLLKRLAERNDLDAAFEYMERYDYLEPDTLVRDKILLGLLEQNPGSEEIWDACPPTDTFRILRLAGLTDPEKRDKLIQKIPGFRGRLMRIEDLLQAGDTVRAFFLFRESPPPELTAEEQYRSAKISRLFDHHAFQRSLVELGKIKGFETKAFLLGSLERGTDPGRIAARDEEELKVWSLASHPDTVSRALPDGMNLDSILFSDTSRAIRLLDSLRSVHRMNYRLDSMYCAKLLELGRGAEAAEAIEPYSECAGVRRYVLTVQGFGLFQRSDYPAALKKFILGQGRSAPVLYRLAECLERTGRDGREYFRQALAAGPDSVLRAQIIKDLLPAEYRAGNYAGLAAFRFDDLAADSGLARVYLKSLARVGRRADSDSLYRAWFGGLDPDYLNGWGEYLIGRKSLAAARILFDSLAADPGPGLSERIYYNWALVAFQAGAYDTAQLRFNFYCARFPNRGNYALALFKIATVKYQLADFDSAGIYYLRCASDTSLKHDALKNAMIAYKKAESWPEVISAGRKFLPVCRDDERAEASFEIGYAHMRSGNFRRAVGFFRTAVELDPEPEYHYWLAETYMGRGDFIRALFHYQAIVNKFPRDEMWGPTAEFKSGLALEFLDATAEARKLYEGIIKRRGRGDIWGKEAVQRLEFLK